MDSNLAMASVPNKPQLEYEAGIAQLPPEGTTVLETIFAGHERVVIAQELGGFSQSRVFVVHPYHLDGSADLPLVVKIGPAWLIQREQEAYHRYIRDKLSGRIGLVKAAITGVWGGLSYRLAGDGQFKHESLYQFCHRPEVEALGEVLQGRLFKRLETLWRNARISTTPYLGARYDLLLPVHLVIEPRTSPSSVFPYLLTPERTTQYALAPGDFVRLEGFEITEVDPTTQAVTVDLPDQNKPQLRSHRLRLQPVEHIETYQPNQPLPSIEGVVIQTRQGSFGMKLKKH